jgi:hypothetical protein
MAAASANVCPSQTAIRERDFVVIAQPPADQQLSEKIF